MGDLEAVTAHRYGTSVIPGTHLFVNLQVGRHRGQVVELAAAVLAPNQLQKLGCLDQLVPKVLAAEFAVSPFLERAPLFRLVLEGLGLELGPASVKSHRPTVCRRGVLGVHGVVWLGVHAGRGVCGV